jgi:hypothetical protein
MKLDDPVTASTFVRADFSVRTSSTPGSAVCRSHPTHRTVAAASAACTHGRKYPSRSTTTSSPGLHSFASARDKS